MTPHEAASYWFVRQDAGGMTATDREAFEEWLNNSPEHRSTYEQTKSTWSGFESTADTGELRALRVSALSSAPTPNVWLRASGVAAVLMIAIASIAALTSHLSSPPESTVSQYVTTRNQSSTVNLPDGTLVFMNLDTAFSTDYTAGQRLIHLIKGQAFFEVAKDAERPFIVAAADREIRALGTKFDVRLDPSHLEVVLLEGRVGVDRSQPSSVDKIAQRPTRIELEPDQKFVASPGEQGSVTAINATQATSWREGWISFEDETLDQAIAELNRYSDRKLVAADDVREMRLSGVFRIGQPDRFGAVIQELLPLQVERGAQGETLLVRRSTEP